MWHQPFPGSHGSDGGRERQTGTEDLLGSTLGNKKKQTVQPWAQGCKKPRTLEQTRTQEERSTETTLGFNPDLKVKGSGKTKTTFIP